METPAHQSSTTSRMMCGFRPAAGGTGGAGGLGGGGGRLGARDPPAVGLARTGLVGLRRLDWRPAEGGLDVEARVSCGRGGVAGRVSAVLAGKPGERAAHAPWACEAPASSHAMPSRAWPGVGGDGGVCEVRGGGGRGVVCVCDAADAVQPMRCGRSGAACVGGGRCEPALMTARNCQE